MPKKMLIDAAHAEETRPICAWSFPHEEQVALMLPPSSLESCETSAERNAAAFCHSPVAEDAALTRRSVTLR